MQVVSTVIHTCEALEATSGLHHAQMYYMNGSDIPSLQHMFVCTRQIA